jgi:hypothetical protein
MTRVFVNSLTFESLYNFMYDIPSEKSYYRMHIDIF